MHPAGIQALCSGVHYAHGSHNNSNGLVIFWVGITDKGWFEQLSLERPVEVNFWQPSAVPVAALEPGTPFLFKLRSPHNFIVGGGWFVRYSALPASVAWKAFETKNGVQSQMELIRRVRGLAHANTSPDPTIACNILENPFFWPREQWIDMSGRWAPEIVRGRRFDTNLSDEAALWSEIRERLEHDPRERLYLPNIADLDHEAPRWTREFLTRARLGQGAFRILVTESYRRRCAVTSERTLPVLEAAHIRPYAAAGPHQLSNGLLLRSDIHTLFDLGYVTVTPDYKLEVSRRIQAEFENGREYYALHGKPLQNLPEYSDERPAAEHLRWHNEKIFHP